MPERSVHHWLLQYEIHSSDDLVITFEEDAYEHLVNIDPPFNDGISSLGPDGFSCTIWK
jgi:hypothetical protein